MLPQALLAPLALAAEPGLPAWALAIGLGLLAAIALGVGWVAVRTAELARMRARLEDLESIRAGVERLKGERGELDLRRVEHALLDIRDGQRKIVDAMLRVAESNAAGAVPGAPAVGAEGMEERVLNRLLALGYERVEIARGGREAWPADDDEEPDEAPPGAGEGEEGTYELRVEARRQGVLHKGKVLVREGRIHDVTMTPSYSIFP